MEREVERIMKYLVEERTVLKLLRTMERQENHTQNVNEGDNEYYSKKYKAWVLRNDSFQLN